MRRHDERWTTTADLRAQVQRRWDRASCWPSRRRRALFPLRLAPEAPPSSDELSERFDEVRAWIAELHAVRPAAASSVREVHHRVLGPEQRAADGLGRHAATTALALIGKAREAARFRACWRARCAAAGLAAWLRSGRCARWRWPSAGRTLLDVVAWLQAIRAPASTCARWTCPASTASSSKRSAACWPNCSTWCCRREAIDTAAVRRGPVRARYGFRDKPARMRLRVLDPTPAVLPGADLPTSRSMPQSFARLDRPCAGSSSPRTRSTSWPSRRPKPAWSSSAPATASTPWRRRAGSQQLRAALLGRHRHPRLRHPRPLRTRFGHVESFLMDRPTLMAHQALWGEEGDQVVHDLPRLTESERALFDELRDNRIRRSVRLEQERVGYKWVTTALGRVIGQGEPPEGY